MQRSSAPLGYDRFMELVKSDFFDDMVLYRTIKGERTLEIYISTLVV